MMMEEKNTIEIDILYLLRRLWQKKIAIVFSAILLGLLAFLFSSFILKATYTSTTRIYVVNQSTAGSALTAQDLQAGTYLVNDYKEIITSDSVLIDVISREGLSTSILALRSNVSVEIPSNTRIITISVQDTDPQMAKRLTNTLREVASEKIKVVTKVEDVTTIEEAKVPESPSSPNTKRNVLLGFLLGGIAATAVVLLLEVLDDRIRRPEDVEEVLGRVLLGIVPKVDKM